MDENLIICKKKVDNKLKLLLCRKLRAYSCLLIFEMKKLFGFNNFVLKKEKNGKGKDGRKKRREAGGGRGSGEWRWRPFC